MAKEMQFEKLISTFGENIDVNCPLPEYPRPQLVRDSYINLNGQWDYAILDKSQKLGEYQGKITVPFSPESVLSGVDKIVMPTDVLYYKRTFELPECFNVGRVLLNFGAVDYLAKVFVNGKEVATHRGGYFPFSIDITDALVDGVNSLSLEVTDPSDTKGQSRGKQKLKRGGIFYTPQSGIWQTVWLESVPQNYIQELYTTPDIDTATVKFELVTPGAIEDATVEIYDGGEKVAEGKFDNNVAVIKIDGFKLWSPEEPNLYDVVIKADEDIITSYFGMRKFSIAKDEHGYARIMLNNKQYFHNGLLDQGYWSDGLYTPPSEEAIIYDIAQTKEMGFNMLRKHIKIEPARWYYHCDRIGVLVWQDMINGGMGANKPLNGFLGFINATPKDSWYALYGRQDADERAEYYVDLERTVKGLYNVVSLALWVPFNESWGQFDANKAVEEIKKLDTTRPIDHASGWHDQGGGDFKSLHIYFRPVTIPKDERSVILSEFGGYSYKVDGHVFNKVKSFGYKKYDTQEGFEKAYHKLFEEQVIPYIPKGLSATVYTQLTDVEDEINGILTYDRKVIKLDVEKLRDLNKKLTY